MESASHAAQIQELIARERAREQRILRTRTPPSGTLRAIARDAQTASVRRPAGASATA